MKEHIKYGNVKFNIVSHKSSSIKVRSTEKSLPFFIFWHKIVNSDVSEQTYKLDLEYFNENFVNQTKILVGCFPSLINFKKKIISISYDYIKEISNNE